MATIKQSDVAECIHALMTAGKKFPLDERRALADNKVKACEQILQETVGLWWKIFGERNISVERWKDAVNKACTITNAGTLNINIISPALMETALKTVEVESVMAARSKHEALKQDKEIMKPSADKWKEYILLRWTVSKLKERRPIMKYKPTADEVWKKGRELGLTEDEIADQHRLIEIHLNDCNYAKANNENMNVEIFLRPDRKLFFRSVG